MDPYGIGSFIRTFAIICVLGGVVIAGAVYGLIRLFSHIHVSWH